jgi:transposase-like protein
MTECPKCGCNGVTLTGAGTRGGRPWARFGCDHCGTQFFAGRESGASEGIVENPVRCPFCSSLRVPVTHTDRIGAFKRRYRKCEGCHRTFHSVAPADVA